jgi:hypothetical protein
VCKPKAVFTMTVRWDEVDGEEECLEWRAGRAVECEGARSWFDLIYVGGCCTGLWRGRTEI